MQRGQMAATLVTLVLTWSGSTAAQHAESRATGASQLAGRVISAATGTPVRRAVVRLYPPSGIEAAATMTDVNGQFEIKQLRPGRYHLVVSKPGYLTSSFGAPGPGRHGRDIVLTAGASKRDVVVALSAGGAIAGRIIDEFGDPVVRGRVEAVRVRYHEGEGRLSTAGTDTTDDNGEFRVFGLAPGEYYVRARTDPERGSADSADGAFVAPTYYPGTPRIAEAQRVSVTTARDGSQLHFGLVPAKVVRVSGTAVDARGQPVAEGFVNLTPRRTTLEGREGAVMGVRPERSGRFTFGNLVAGEYLLTVTHTPLGSGAREYGVATVTVTDDDVDVQVVTSPGATAAGQVVVDDGTQPPLEPKQLAVEARPSWTGDFPHQGILSRTPGQDWTFRMTDLAGPYEFSVRGLPDGWSVKFITVDGDVLDQPVTIPKKDEASRIQLVLTRQTTEVRGSVTDASGNQITGYSVVVFAADPRKWQTRSGHVRTGLIASDGTFRILSLPPGDYKAFASDLLDEGELTSPDALRRLAPRATSFTLSEGQRHTLTLPLVEWAQ